MHRAEIKKTENI